MHSMLNQQHVPSDDFMPGDLDLLKSLEDRKWFNLPFALDDSKAGILPGPQS